MLFLRNIIFHFSSKEKVCFREKEISIFPDNTRKIMFQCNFFEKNIFSERLKKVSYFHLFF